MARVCVLVNVSKVLKGVIPKHLITTLQQTFPATRFQLERLLLTLSGPLTFADVLPQSISKTYQYILIMSACIRTFAGGWANRMLQRYIP